MHTRLTTTEISSIGALSYGAVPPLTVTLDGEPMTSRRQPRSRVLCISRDLILGETRRAVLQRRFDTVFLSSSDEVYRQLHAASFDVLVLCHTLFPEERQRCFVVARRLWPMAKIVLVASGDDSSQQGFDRVVRGLAGPEVLLHAVQQVLRPAVAFVNLD